MGTLCTNPRRKADICAVDTVRPIDHRPGTLAAWPVMNREP